MRHHVAAAPVAADELERDCTHGNRSGDSGDLLPSLHAQARSVQPEQLHCDNGHDQRGNCRAPLTTLRHGWHVDRTQDEPRAAGGDDVDREEPSFQPAPHLTDRRLVSGFLIGLTSPGLDPEKLRVCHLVERFVGETPPNLFNRGSPPARGQF